VLKYKRKKSLILKDFEVAEGGFEPRQWQKKLSKIRSLHILKSASSQPVLKRTGKDF
jgi:hypothetical protein